MVWSRLLEHSLTDSLAIWLILAFTEFTNSFLFVRFSQYSITILLLYVDDLVITGNDSRYIAFLISQLSVVFEMKILGKLHHFLRVEVNPIPNGLFLSQIIYSKDHFARTDMNDAKPCGSPSSHKQPATTIESSLLIDPSAYHSITGALQYLTLTRPNLVFVVNHLCQHLHQPTQADFTALKRVLCYLKGSLSHGVSFHKGSLCLVGFSDANWAGDLLNRRCISGFCIFLGGSPISWSSKKQPTVARSSIEAEYGSLAHTTAEMC